MEGDASLFSNYLQGASCVLGIEPGAMDTTVKTTQSSSTAHSSISFSDEAEKAQRRQTEYARSHSSGGKKSYTASQASCFILLPATSVTPVKHTSFHPLLFISSPCSVASSLLLPDGQVGLGSALLSLSSRMTCLPIKDDSSISGRV